MKVVIHNVLIFTGYVAIFGFVFYYFGGPALIARAALALAVLNNGG